MSKDIRTMIDTMKPTMVGVLPKHMNVDRFALTAVIALNKTRDLEFCTMESWKVALMTAAELGLDCSGTTGMSYLVPFNNNIGTREQPKWEKQVTLIPGYRGLMDLARRTGCVTSFQAHVVYEKDEFTVYLGTDNPRIVHVPFVGSDRGKVIAVYAVARLPDGTVQPDWMTAEDVEKIRQMSKAKNAGAWTNSWNEMAKKTIVRRLCKYLPTSAELNTALSLDAEFEEAEYREAEVVKPEPPRAIPERKMDRMAARFVEAERVPVEAESEPVPERNASLFPDDDDDLPDWDGPVETNRAN